MSIPMQPRGIQPRGRHLRGIQPRGIQPRGSDGDGDELDLDPLLASAAGLWRASQLPDGWVIADTWPNEGTAGSAIDLTEYDGTSLDGDPPAADPTLETTGNRGVECAAADPLNAGDEVMLQALDHASLDMGGSFSYAIDYTPLTVDPSVTSIRYLRKIDGGILQAPGIVFEDIAPANSDLVVITSAGTGAVFNTDYSGFVTSDPAAGRHTLVVTVTATTMKAWLDGVSLTSPANPADLSGVGSPDNAQPIYVGAGQRLHNLAWWDDDLTEVEAASLDAKLRSA